MNLLGNLEALGPVTDLVSGVSWPQKTLKKEIQSRAGFLKAKKIGPGSMVLIAHGGTPHFFADLLAVWQLGACAACLNPALTPNELKNIAAFVEPAMILRGPGEEKKNLDGLAEFDLANQARGKPGNSPSLPADSPALVLFTSGTTGRPKGVVHTFDSIEKRLRNNWRHLSGEVLSRSLCVLPTHFGHGLIGNCLTPLFSGCGLFLYPRPGIAGAAGLGKRIDENRITFLSSVPSFWRVVLKASSKPEGGTLRQVSVGSAPLTADLWRAIQEWAGIKNVSNMYGITETANWAAGISGAEKDPADGLVGRMWGGKAAVLTEKKEQQGIGEGEILLKTPSLMEGYLKRPDLSAKVLENGWYKTGDWGKITKEGLVYLLGRTKTEINKAGIKILPEEIDMLLERHKDIQEACAFGIPDQISGETVAVAVTLKPGVSLGAPELRKWCRERIRADAIPEKWFFIGQIPKTERGKINRAMVREFCLEEEGAR